MRALIVIVIYRKHLSEVLPLIYFNDLQSSDFEIFIYDNSPESAISDNFKFNHRFVYHHDPTNKGVSHAYNFAAQYAMENGFDWLILFDQDTEISEEYYPQLKSAITKYPHIKVFTPIVKYNDGIMSPRKCHYFRPLPQYLEVGINSLEKVAIINSGLAISVKAFIDCGGYNEDLKLDLSDYQFIERLQKTIKNFYLLPAELYQDFSNNETDNEKLFRRFVTYCDSIKNYNTSQSRLIVLRYTGLLHACALTKRTRNIKFITHYLKTLVK